MTLLYATNDNNMPQHKIQYDHELYGMYSTNLVGQQVSSKRTGGKAAVDTL
jgi:uncharacterized protein YwgA